MAAIDQEMRKIRERQASDRPCWVYRVMAKFPDDDRASPHAALAYHRADAKQQIAEYTDGVEFGEVYVPRPSADCPCCGTHEAAVKEPNMKGKWDWTCRVCSSKFAGHPYDPEVVIDHAE